MLLIERLTKRFKPADFSKNDNLTIGNRLFGLWVPTMRIWYSLTFILQCSTQLNFRFLSLKCNINQKWRNLGLSKKWKPHFDVGGLIRGSCYTPKRLDQRYFSFNSNISDSSSVSLKKLIKDNLNTEHFSKSLIQIVSNREILILSYEIIKNKPGNSNPGSDNSTLDKINLN